MLHQYDIVFRTVLTRSCVRFECRPPACRQTPVFRHHSETTDRSRFAALNPLQCEHTDFGSIRQRPIGVDLIQMAAGDTTACSTPCPGIGVQKTGFTSSGMLASHAPEQWLLMFRNMQRDTAKCRMVEIKPYTRASSALRNAPDSSGLANTAVAPKLLVHQGVSSRNGKIVR